MEKSDYKHIIYDLEVYPNIFTLCAVFSDGRGLRVYEVSDRKDETEEILQFLRNIVKNKYQMVGFNNAGFDYPLLHYIIEKKKASKDSFKINPADMYKEAQKVIDFKRQNEHKPYISEDKFEIGQVDLYLINHFNNKAKATSLKMLEFNMRMENIEDLPYKVGQYLTDEQKDVLIEYNKHDVLATLRFYNYCQGAIKLRSELTEKFGFDTTNFNDTKIGKELFIRTLEKKKPGVCYTQKPYGGKTINKTNRSEIIVADCIFPYVKFDRPEFNAILEWFKKQIITETKGVFSDLLEKDLGDVAKYAQMVVKRQKLNDPIDKKNKRYVPSFTEIQMLKRGNPFGWVEEKELKSPKGAKSYYWCWNVSETLNVVIDGFRFDYGVGGIHGCREGVYTTNDEVIVRTLDVASYYPNMAIANKIYPEHLGTTFCDVYQGLYEERKKTAKGSGANAALKLALNGTYGETNNEYSPLYDPKYTMSITINGQLSLCMLMEQLINKCNAKILVANTDGFEYQIKRNMIEKADELVKWWEQLTGLTMEGDTYAKLMMADVNSYLGIYQRDNEIKVKTKGRYEVLPYDQLGWHKNHSCQIVPYAALRHLVYGENYKDVIQNHKDEYDFMLRVKVDRSSRLVLIKNDGTEIPQQNICRYYPSKSGGKLMKIMPPLKDKLEAGERPLSIDAEWIVQPCNNMKDFSWDNLNYEYFFAETRKLIEPFEDVE